MTSRRVSRWGDLDGGETKLRRGRGNRPDRQKKKKPAVVATLIRPPTGIKTNMSRFLPKEQEAAQRGIKENPW